MAAFCFSPMQIEIESALNTKQAANFLGLRPGSLSVMRCRGSGPPCHYSGAKPVYYASELRAWQLECAERRRKRASASEAEARPRQSAENAEVERNTPTSEGM